MTILRRAPSNEKHEATIDCATVAFWCIVIVFFWTPRIGASRLPVSAPIVHQPSYHALTPRPSQSSANFSR